MSNSTDAVIENKPIARVAGWIKVSFVLLTLLTLSLFGIVGFGYWQMTSLMQGLQTDQQQVATLQTAMSQLKQVTDKSTELSVKQEQMIGEWQAAQKGDLNKWYVAEAQYLVRLANDHISYTNNVAMTLILLQRADQILQNLNDPSVAEIRRVLGVNISALQQLPQVNITNLYLQFATLNQQLDQLVLPPQPLKANKKSDETTTTNTDESWWQKGIDKSWEALSKIVIIRNNSTNMLPIVMPDEKVFLYQNLHAQMESVMWAVLHRDNHVYQASIARMMIWVQQYFDQDASATQTMLQNLVNMKKINLQTQSVDLTATLQVFDNYFSSSSAA